MLEKIANHFEFLGYKVDRIKNESDRSKDLLSVKSEANPTLLILQIDDGLTLLRANFGCDKGYSTDMDSAINIANSNSDVMTVYYEKDNEGKITIRCNVVYLGEYQRDTFGRLVSLFNKDIQRLFINEAFSKAFID